MVCFGGGALGSDLSYAGVGGRVWGVGSRGCHVRCRGLKHVLFGVGCSAWSVRLCIVELGCRVQGSDVTRLNRGQGAGV